ncbi:hypothetical protein [Bradyrhizobium sp. Ec3.3]|uniref:hypothetical protein n=1 Tax=Bradyrhizobium sp. Ec3.3 TaxID=189753 RepID=UPI0012EB999B|nr:hypothetical protein [Bradyrhizobium sp. Ec3.3]
MSAEPTPTERRNMLIAAAEDFNRLHPPGPSEPQTAEEQVDEAIAAGIVSLAPQRAHSSASPEEESDDFDWDNPDEESIVLRDQRATAAYRNKGGELIIRQRAGWNDEHDAFIFVSPENEIAFLENLAKRHRES